LRTDLARGDEVRERRSIGLCETNVDAQTHTLTHTHKYTTDYTRKLQCATISRVHVKVHLLLEHRVLEQTQGTGTHIAY